MYHVIPNFKLTITPIVHLAHISKELGMILVILLIKAKTLANHFKYT